MYDDGEDWIGAGHDTGIDGCHDQLEDGNDGCIGPEDHLVYDIYTNIFQWARQPCLSHNQYFAFIFYF